MMNMRKKMNMEMKIYYKALKTTVTFEYARRLESRRNICFMILLSAPMFAIVCEVQVRSGNDRAMIVIMMMRRRSRKGGGGGGEGTPG